MMKDYRNKQMMVLVLQDIIEYQLKRLIVKYRKISKRRDYVVKLLDRYDIQRTNPNTNLRHLNLREILQYDA